MTPRERRRFLKAHAASKREHAERMREYWASTGLDAHLPILMAMLTTLDFFKVLTRSRKQS